MLKVPNSEKCPSSKPRTKCASSLLIFCSACPWPRGKYHMSPSSKVSVAAWPFGEITVVRTLPFTTNAHSAAIACQCSSRMPPGFRRIETPAMLFDTGNSSTVASFRRPGLAYPSGGSLNVEFEILAAARAFRDLCPPGTFAAAACCAALAPPSSQHAGAKRCNRSGSRSFLAASSHQSLRLLIRILTPQIPYGS